MRLSEGLRMSEGYDITWLDLKCKIYNNFNSNLSKGIDWVFIKMGNRLTLIPFHRPVSCENGYFMFEYFKEEENNTGLLKNLMLTPRIVLSFVFQY